MMKTRYEILTNGSNIAAAATATPQIRLALASVAGPTR